MTSRRSRDVTVHRRTSTRLSCHGGIKLSRPSSLPTVLQTCTVYIQIAVKFYACAQTARRNGYLLLAAGEFCDDRSRDNPDQKSQETLSGNLPLRSLDSDQQKVAVGEVDIHRNRSITKYVKWRSRI